MEICRTWLQERPGHSCGGIGFMCFYLGRSHKGLTIRNTTFRPLMRQAMQLRTLSTALIESNLVEGIGGMAALAAGTPEGRDIRILNNTFRIFNRR